MTTIIRYATWTLGLMMFALVALVATATVSSTARAERMMEDASSTAFKVFESDREGGRSSRRSRASSSDSDDDQPVRSRRARAAKASSEDDQPVRQRRARIAAQSSDNDQPAPARNRAKGRQVASLGGGEEFSAPKPGRSLSGGGNITWAASAGCLNGSLRSAVAHVAANYGSVTVNSTCRSAGHNRSVGGAPKSYHLSGDAVDLRVHGNASGAASYLASLGGGYKHYGGGLFHVDTGPRRPF